MKKITEMQSYELAEVVNVRRDDTITVIHEDDSETVIATYDANSISLLDEYTQHEEGQLNYKLLEIMREQLEDGFYGDSFGFAVSEHAIELLYNEALIDDDTLAAYREVL